MKRGLVDRRRQPRAAGQEGEDDAPPIARRRSTRINGTTDKAKLAACDLVIEAATENEELKVKILKDLCATLRPQALVATNTSSISITKLAAATDRPDRFIGMHFFNPVPVMALLELIRGLQTSDDTHAKARSFRQARRQGADHRARTARASPSTASCAR